MDDLYFSHYALDHLPQHIFDRNRLETMRDIFECETNEEKNAWFVAQNQRQRVGTYLDQLDIAEQMIDKQDKSANEKIYGLICTYRLMRASVNSLAKSLPAKLIFQLTKHEIWTIRQAIDYIVQISDDDHIEEAIRLICTLQPIFDDKDVSLLNRLNQVRDPIRALHILKLISPLLSPKQGEEALKIAYSLPSVNKNQRIKSSALISIIPLLQTNDALEFALEHAKILHDLEDQCIILSALINVLTKPLLAKVWDFVYYEIENQSFRDRLFSILIPARLRHSESIDLSIISSVIDNKWEHIRAFIGILPYLGLSFKNEILMKIEDYSQRIVLCDASDPAILSLLLPLCNDALFPKIVEKLLNQWDLKTDVWFFFELAKRLSLSQQINLFHMILDFLKNPAGEWQRSLIYRNKVLNNLIPIIPDVCLEQAFHIALMNFRELCCDISSLEQKIDPILLNTPMSIGYESITGHILVNTLSEHLDFGTIQNGMDPFIAIAARAPIGLLSPVLEIIHTFSNGLMYLEAVSMLAPYLPETVFETIVKQYLKIIEGQYNTFQAPVAAELVGRTFVRLFPRIESSKKEKFLDHSIYALRKLCRQKTLASILTDIADVVPLEISARLLREALDLYTLIDDRETYILARISLLKQLPQKNYQSDIETLHTLINQVYPALEKDSMIRRLTQCDRELLLLELSKIVAANGQLEKANTYLTDLDQLDRLNGMLDLLSYTENDQQYSLFLNQTLQVARLYNLEARWVEYCLTIEKPFPSSHFEDLLQIIPNLPDLNLRAKAYAFVMPQLPISAQGEIAERLMRILENVPSLDLTTIYDITKILDILPLGIKKILQLMVVEHRYQLRIWEPWPYTVLQRCTMIETLNLDEGSRRETMSNLKQELPDIQQMLYPKLVALPELLVGMEHLKVLTLLEASLNIPVLGIVSQHIQHLDNDRQRIAALTCLLPTLPRQMRGRVIDRIFEWIEKSDGLLSSFELAQIFLGIAPYCSPQTHSFLASTAMGNCIKAYFDIHKSYGIITPCDIVIKRFSVFSQSIIAELWREINDSIKNKKRSEVFSLLWILSPIFSLLGGSCISDEIFDGIDCVVRWWPM